MRRGWEWRARSGTNRCRQGHRPRDAQGKELWVSVKGYPEKSTHVQARHWFAGAVFELMLYRHESATARPAIALPEGFRTYANLASWPAGYAGS